MVQTSSAGLSPCRSGGRILFSRVNFLCWLLFRYPFHPRVTVVARERSRSFRRKCRRQVTDKHACTLRMWLCMKCRGMAHGCMVSTERAETAAVSLTWHQPRNNQTALQVHYFGGCSKMRYKQLVTHVESHHSSGAVWESRWLSWVVRPNEPSDFRGRKAILNHASAVVSACPWYVSRHLRTLSITSSSLESDASAVSLLESGQ